MIPDAKRPAVTHALDAAFGGNEYEDIRSTTAGQSSALVYRMIVAGKPCLLKIMRTEKLSAPAHEFACMRTAAEAVTRVGAGAP
jgi:hypothetical protein